MYVGSKANTMKVCKRVGTGTLDEAIEAAAKPYWSLQSPNACPPFTNIFLTFSAINYLSKLLYKRYNM
jgi:hypothetical protein